MSTDHESIYGSNKPLLEEVASEVMDEIQTVRERLRADTGIDPVEHCLYRIKCEASMRDKCDRKGLPQTTRSALVTIHDAIGIRVVCAFRSDVYAVRDHLASLPGFEVTQEKDFIRNAKPNGYRSYHLIMRTCDGRVPAACEPGPSDVDAEPVRGVYLEIQLRTISMDTWAALDHQLQYKQEMVGNAKLISSELKRCADELASTDLSMQAIRDMIADARKETE